MPQKTALTCRSMDTGSLGLFVGRRSYGSCGLQGRASMSPADWDLWSPDPAVNTLDSLCGPRAILEHILQCGWAHCPASGGHLC